MIVVVVFLSYSRIVVVVVVVVAVAVALVSGIRRGVCARKGLHGWQRVYVDLFGGQSLAAAATAAAVMAIE